MTGTLARNEQMTEDKWIQILLVLVIEVRNEVGSVADIFVSQMSISSSVLARRITGKSR